MSTVSRRGEPGRAARRRNASATVAGVKAYLPAFWALPGQFLAGTAAAGSVGFINSVGNLVGFRGPYVIGRVEAVTGSFATGLLFVGVSSLAAAALLMALPRR
jgi:hypothetical protein